MLHHPASAYLKQSPQSSTPNTVVEVAAEVSKHLLEEDLRWKLIEVNDIIDETSTRTLPNPIK